MSQICPLGPNGLKEKLILYVVNVFHAIQATLHTCHKLQYHLSLGQYHLVRNSTGTVPRSAEVFKKKFYYDNYMVVATQTNTRTYACATSRYYVHNYLHTQREGGKFLDCAIREWRTF